MVPTNAVVIVLSSTMKVLFNTEKHKHVKEIDKLFENNKVYARFKSF